MTDHMRDYMAGLITSREYFERVKRDTDEMIATNLAMIAEARRQRADQNKRVRAAQRRLRRALRRLKRAAS